MAIRPGPAGPGDDPGRGRPVKDEMFTQGESFALTEGMTLGLKALTRRVREVLDASA